MQACMNHNKEMVDLLLVHGAAIDFTDPVSSSKVHLLTECLSVRVNCKESPVDGK